MFTGIITDIGTIKSKTDKGDFITFEIECSYKADSIDLGASIAHSGVCLTAIDIKQINKECCLYTVDVSPETLDKTTACDWNVGSKVNLERALSAGDEFGGHMVSGHVDQPTKIIKRENFNGGAKFTIAMSEEIKPFIADKGSITLDGTSLTVNKVNENDFEIMLIPHTLEVTTWGQSQTGDLINLEIDTFARYVARYVDSALAAKGL